METALAHSGRSTAAPAATHVTDDPADYEVTFNRACVLTANKQFSAALPLLDEALERARKTLAAEAAEGQSTVEEAEQELNAFRLQRAYILQGSGHLDEARAVYREILDKKYKMWFWHSYSGLTLRKHHHFFQAL